jgi:hypothetical protein
VIQDVLDLGASESKRLLCITLWQPWASWIMWGWKTIETRLHPRFESLAGKRIGIHAGKTWDTKAIACARPYLTTEQIRQTSAQLATLPRQALLGTAFVEKHGCTEESDAAKALIDCYVARYGLWLGELEVFERPLSCKGHQGIWTFILP